mmetsp:Transcript_104711/g.312770  ORF Transcript_104711/g.312770 Transcript_104711/m.312770 type:complete len:234 (+) Transcript_104711:141-842(+)
MQNTRVTSRRPSRTRRTGLCCSQRSAGRLLSSPLPGCPPRRVPHTGRKVRCTPLRRLQLPSQPALRHHRTHRLESCRCRPHRQRPRAAPEATAVAQRLLPWPQVPDRYQGHPAPEAPETAAAVGWRPHWRLCSRGRCERQSAPLEGRLPQRPPARRCGEGLPAPEAPADALLEQRQRWECLALPLGSFWGAPGSACAGAELRPRWQGRAPAPSSRRRLCRRWQTAGSRAAVAA